MLKLRAVLILFVTTLFIAACVTVLGGTTENIAVTTFPGDASCGLERGGNVLATPETVEVSKDEAPIRLVCSKPSHLDTSRVLLAGFEGFSAGDLIFGGMVGVVVKASTGAVNQYPTEFSVMLPPAWLGDIGERDAFFDTLKADAEFRAVDALAAANASSLCRKDPDNQDCVALLIEIEDGRAREQDLIENQRLEAEIGS